MIYRGTITFDFNGPERVRNARAKLTSALIEAGWLYVETTTFALETGNLGEVWRGIELVAKGSANGGDLSAVTFNVVAAADFASSKPYTAAKNHPDALREISALRFPQP